MSASPNFFDNPLTLLPDYIEPGMELPELSGLKHRIADLERQRLVLFVDQWIADNAHWLEHYPLRLLAFKERQFDATQGDLISFNKALTGFEVLPREQRRPWQREVNRLTDLLNDCANPHDDDFISGSSPDERFAERLVEELNAVQWHPGQAKAALVRTMHSFMSDPMSWLDRHNAARQARDLLHTTEPARAERAPRRL